jgi:fumarylacetoacetate (FAA) hydrolase
MKLISYLFDGHDHLAILVDGRLYEMENLHPDIPGTMGMFLQYWEDAFPMAYGGELMVTEGRIDTDKGNDPSVAEIIAPVPFPASYRSVDGSTTGVPSYIFGNHHSLRGEGEVICASGFLSDLHFIPQLAVVIGRAGRNIRADEADAYIAGFMLMNKFVSASSEHFASATGPWLVTTNELSAFETAAEPAHIGKAWNIGVNVRINDEERGVFTRLNTGWTLAELIEKISYGIDLFPGDIIGCGLSGNNNVLLKAGDVVELEAEALGTLINTIVAEEEMG